MMASLANLRQRKRCRKCNQEVLYSVYARHLNPSVCPEVRCNTSGAAQFVEDTEDNVQEQNSAGNGDALQEENSAENVDALQQQAKNADSLQQQVLAGDDPDGAEACDSLSVSSSSSESGSEDESQECVSCSEEVDTLSQSDCEDESFWRSVSGKYETYCSSDLTFFQLCYRISE